MDDLDNDCITTSLTSERRTSLIADGIPLARYREGDTVTLIGKVPRREINPHKPMMITLKVVVHKIGHVASIYYDGDMVATLSLKRGYIERVAARTLGEIIIARRAVTRKHLLRRKARRQAARVLGIEEDGDATLS